MADLAASLGDFGSSVKSLGTSDSNQPLASALTQLGEVQEKLKGIQLTQVSTPRLCGAHVRGTVREITAQTDRPASTPTTLQLLTTRPSTTMPARASGAPQAESDELEFVSVVDEYVRLIGSVKVRAGPASLGVASMQACPRQGW